MPLRYSGQLNLLLRYFDARSVYTVHVAERGKSATWHTDVMVPAVLTHPVDAPEAYDEVARSALSFLADEEERNVTDADLIRFADWDDSGPAVTRVKV